MTLAKTTLEGNFCRVMETVERARERVTQAVTVIAVSKRQPDELVEAALELGIRDFGENYVQDLVRRKAMFPGVRWHLIGHLQTNKAKHAVQADLVHTIDSERTAAALVKCLAPAEPLPVLIQVNTSGQATKSGCREDEVEPLVERLLATPQLELSGLMCVPGTEPRREFARLRELRDRVARSLSCSLPDLSMGMSSDFEDAILEGATMIRLGTILFGARAPRQDPAPPSGT